MYVKKAVLKIHIWLMVVGLTPRGGIVIEAAESKTFGKRRRYDDYIKALFQQLRMFRVRDVNNMINFMSWIALHIKA